MNAFSLQYNASQRAGAGQDEPLKRLCDRWRSSSLVFVGKLRRTGHRKEVRVVGVGQVPGSPGERCRRVHAHDVDPGWAAVNEPHCAIKTAGLDEAQERQRLFEQKLPRKDVHRESSYSLSAHARIFTGNSDPAATDVVKKRVSENPAAASPHS
jgi:hypothetical protein